MSHPIKFTGVNTVMKAPEGADDIQDMYVFRTAHACVSGWQLDAAELAEIIQTGQVFLSVLMQGEQPPVYVSSETAVRALLVDYGPVWAIEPTAGNAQAPSLQHLPITAEMIDAGCAVAMKMRGQGWPGDYSEDEQGNVRKSIQAVLVAAYAASSNTIPSPQTHLEGATFLRKLVENAFSWGKQDCNYLNPTHIEKFIEATRNGMLPKEAATWVANGPSPKTHVKWPEFGSFGSATAMMDVIDERLRQQRVEGWRLEDDDIHTNGELAGAAACYILHNLSFKIPNIKLGHQAAMMARELWPWAWSWWKPTDRRRDLVKAAALLIAEIERLDRAALATEGM